MNACNVDGCDAKYYANGYCYKHYQRVKKHGTPDDNYQTHAPLADRFWRRVVKGQPGECWGWTGAISNKGYGYLQRGGKGSPNVYGHRLSYEIHKGAIPDGLFILHECDNPKCTNPDHLRAGTQSENIQDAVKRGRWKAIPPRHSGASHPNAISIETAKAVADANGTPTDLAIKFSIDRRVVKSIKNGTHWSCRQ